MVCGRAWGIFADMRSSTARGTRFAGWLAGAGLACFALGCSGDPEPEPSAPSVWVGEVKGTDIKVALADKGGGAAVLFFCGGDESYTMSTRWFADGAAIEEPFDFEDSGGRVDGAVKGAAASGSARTDRGETLSWSASAINSATIAGLYEGTAPCGKLGLIVTQATADDAPSGQGACVRADGDAIVVEQVNPIRLAPSATHELAVQVASAPEREFTVRPVAAGAR